MSFTCIASLWECGVDADPPLQLLLTCGLKQGSPETTVGITETFEPKRVTPIDSSSLFKLSLILSVNSWLLSLTICAKV